MLWTTNEEFQRNPKPPNPLAFKETRSSHLEQLKIFFQNTSALSKKLTLFSHPENPCASYAGLQGSRILRTVKRGKLVTGTVTTRVVNCSEYKTRTPETDYNNVIY